MTIAVDSSSSVDLPMSTSPVHAVPKRTLHPKKSFHKPNGALGYDASEEDNDGPTTDDGASSIVPRRPNHGAKNGNGFKKHHLAVAADEDEDPGLDSPTYDGDIESYTTPSLSTNHKQHSSSENTASTLTSPISRASVLPDVPLQHPAAAFVPIKPSPLAKGQSRIGTPCDFDPATVTPEEIQSWVRDVVAGHREGTRSYKINPPPEGRPVVIYADGEPVDVVVI